MILQLQRFFYCYKAKAVKDQEPQEGSFAPAAPLRPSTAQSRRADSRVPVSLLFVASSLSDNFYYSQACHK